MVDFFTYLEQICPNITKNIIYYKVSRQDVQEL